MDNQEDESAVVVVRDNTVVLLLFLLTLAVTMILLSVALVRLGNITRKLDTLATPPPPRLSGGYDTYFYV